MTENGEKTVKGANKPMFAETGGFVHDLIKGDLGDDLQSIKTRFPPEPSGYLHIGHARNILLNYGLAAMYGGTFNLRFDDTNPAKEDGEFVESIIEDVKWLGAVFDGEPRYASDYFRFTYDKAVELIEKGDAFVCDLTADEVREYRGTLQEPGRESPYRNRSVAENLDLFRRMKDGEFPDGSRTLRAKIDMSSPNINMRDPVIYRIARLTHQHTGDEWLIYPMYDFAHPLQDAYEGITHSICTLEFEDHRPLYDWVISRFDWDVKPRQIEVAKMYVSDTVSGKRYIKKLVEDNIVDGWDDPRLITIAAMRRRGYRASAIRDFCERAGVSKATGKTDFSMLEYCVREDLKLDSKVVMAVLDPIKVVIDNYPDEIEWLEIENNAENPALGSRKVPFGRELYIERADFMEDAPNKFFRLKPGGEVRLKGAYFIKCEGVDKDAGGNVAVVHCSYDPETKSGSGFDGRKVKGTIHWVECSNAVKATAMMYESLVFDDDTAEGGKRFNDDSLKRLDGCVVEPSVAGCSADDRFQFMRNGYFCRDSHEHDGLVFNLIVPLKSSYKP